MKFQLCLLFVLIIGCFCDYDSPKVTIKNGEIKGYLKPSFKGNLCAAFEGIPYAKPPIGKLRYEEPEPAESWNETLVTRFEYECIQCSIVGNIVTGQEDCLYINVYVPRAKPNPEEKLDVIVHIHGGAFMLGSGTLTTDSEILMDHDVIFVSFNYRLGLLGFLSTGDEALPGNLGLKDQVLALKWVHENIASFGGNPDSVTLNGVSAGGASVHLHMLSPLTPKVFHRAHSESGSALDPWVLKEEPLESAKRLATLVGCEDDTTHKLVNCLRTIPAIELVSQVPAFRYGGGIPISPFAAVIDTASKNPFLPKHPLKIIEEKTYKDVPWLVCTCSEEGYFMNILLGSNLKEINKMWTQYAPYALEYNYTAPLDKHNEITKRIKNFYVGETISRWTAMQYYQMITDRLFASGAELAAEKHAEANKSSVYYYLFNYRSYTYSYLTIRGIVTHGISGNYIYGRPSEHNISKIDRMMIDIISNMLLSFVKTGVPKIKDVKWEPTGSSRLTFLKITTPTNIKLQTVAELTPKKFWNSLGLAENENIIH